MKKLIMCSLLMVVASVLLVGCGSTKKVVCTNESSEEGMVQRETITGTFKDNKVSKLEMKVDLELSGQYADSIDLLYSTFESQYKSFEEDGIKVNTSKKNNTITVTITMEPDKMKSDNELSVVDDDATPENMKEEFTALGYTCK